MRRERVSCDLCVLGWGSFGRDIFRKGLGDGDDPALSSVHPMMLEHIRVLWKGVIYTDGDLLIN